MKLCMASFVVVVVVVVVATLMDQLDVLLRSIYCTNFHALTSSVTKKAKISANGHHYSKTLCSCLSTMIWLEFSICILFIVLSFISDVTVVIVMSWKFEVCGMLDLLL